PILRDMLQPLGAIETLAQQLSREVNSRLNGRAEVSVESCMSQIGSGALPLDLLESRALVFRPRAAKGRGDAELQRLAGDFRKLPKPVIGRIHDGRFMLDVRCLRDVNTFLDQLVHLPA
ncbi:MAG: L-seryl-tRNA(Sec) selenium transferase, partial [Pseudomonadales bacterium]